MSIVLNTEGEPAFGIDGAMLYSVDPAFNAAQHLRVWLYTGVGTEIIDETHGFNMREILGNRWKNVFGVKKFIELEMQRAVDALSDYVATIEIQDVTVEDNHVTVSLFVTSTAGTGTTMMVDVA